MFSKRFVKTLLASLILGVVSFSACGLTQGSETLDQEEAKAKILHYFATMFPQLGDLTVQSFETQDDSPFLKGTVTFTSRGRQQVQPIFITADGRHLILGQIWDLDNDPEVARWEEKKRGAEERLQAVDVSDRPVKGNPEGAVLVVEFSDYQCPFCSRAYTGLEQQLLAEYGDRIKFVFKHLPLDQIHPWARKASIAAACTYVQDPEKFWGMHSRLFENQKVITVENLREKVDGFGQDLELDTAALLECYDNDRTASVVETDVREAAQLNITSTPTFLINGALVSGAIPFAEMSSYIDQALKESEQR